MIVTMIVRKNPAVVDDVAAPVLVAAAAVANQKITQHQLVL